MRFFRSLFLYFMNNERLINKLAESKPIRKAAQFVVYMLCKTGTLHGTSRITNPQEFGQLLKKIAQTFKEDLKKVKDDLKKNSPK